MAVAPTGNIFKALSFDNVSSRTYGVYITGEAVYNAPERDVEMVEIPGRNGSFALDKGRFQNIEVSYPAGIFADNEADFAAAISDFRNFLCSRKGYVRLTDEYNPNEYRMAIYKSGLEVTPAQLKAGEFEITFDCKPQRWLTSGETAVSVSSGGSVSNPTLFDAKPQIQFQGYGDIVLSGQTIAVDQITVGKVLLANGKRTSLEYPDSGLAVLEEVARDSVDTNALNTGDDIVLDLSSFSYTWTATYFADSIITATATSQTGSGVSTTATKQSDKTALFYTEFEPITFKKGTASTKTHTYSMLLEYGSSGTTSVSGTITVQINYNGASVIKLSATHEQSSGSITVFGTCNMGTVTGYSTVQAAGDITIDLDTGESYWMKNSKKISADNSIRMNARLPVLVPGTNVITYDNTITNFKITPNWWKV